MNLSNLGRFSGPASISHCPSKAFPNDPRAARCLPSGLNSRLKVQVKNDCATAAALRVKEPLLLDRVTGSALQVAGQVYQGSGSGLTREGSKDLLEVIDTEGCPLSPCFDRPFVFHGLDQIYGEVSDDGHGVGAMAFSDPYKIVFEDDVQRPVQRVFDEPVSPDCIGAGPGARTS
jgi:hypothetical protein